jgi:hypothetical protein
MSQFVVGNDAAGNGLELDAERSVPIGVKSRAFLVVLRYAEQPRPDPDARIVNRTRV